MKCPNCGKEIAEESQFCEYCGKKVQPTSGECGIYIGWLLIVALLFVCLINFAFMFVRNASDAWDFSTLLIILQVVVLLVGLVMAFLKKIRLPLIILACVQFSLGIMLCIDAMNYNTVSIGGMTYAALYKNHTATSFIIAEKSTQDKDRYGYLRSHIEAIDNCKEFAQEISKPNLQYSIGDIQWYTSRTYNYWGHTYIYAWTDIALVLLYLIYAFIACKKGWQY